MKLGLLVSACALPCMLVASSWTFTPNASPDGSYIPAQPGADSYQVDGWVSDGNYTLGVLTNASRQVFIGGKRRASGGTSFYLCHALIAGSGDLDLCGQITDTNGNVYALAEMKQQCLDTYILGLSGTNIPQQLITSVRLPSSCKTIGSYAFRRNKKLSIIEFNTAIALSECSFCECSGLTEVWFKNGAPTSFGPTTSGKRAFESDAGAGKIRMYLDWTSVCCSDGWSSALGSLVLDDAVRTAFAQAYPSENGILRGQVPAGVMGTSSAQYACMQQEFTSAPVLMTAGCESFVSIQPPASQDGKWEYGTQLTVSVTEDDTVPGWRFSRFEGDFPDGETTVRSVTFELTPKPVSAIFNRAWKYGTVDGQNCISDSLYQWVLKVGIVSSPAKTLSISENSSLSFDGAGPLDLSGPIVDDAGNHWTITKLNGNVFRAATFTNRIDSFVTPTTVERIDYNMLSGRTDVTNVIIRSDVLTYINQNICMNCTNLQSARFESKSLKETTPADSGNNAYIFPGCSKLVKLVVKLPNLGTVRHNFANGPLTDSNLADWDLSSVTNVYSSAFVAPEATRHGAMGFLNLPKLQTIGNDAFNQWSRLTELRLGSGELVSLSARAVMFLQGVRRITLGVAPGFTAQQNCFGYNWLESLTNITFVGRNVPSAANLTNMLTVVNTLGTNQNKRPTIIVEDNEETARTWCEAPTADERANWYPSAAPKVSRLLGVYAHKAWVYYVGPRGLFLLLR